MAQLYYRYGAMNSGKSIEVMKVAYNYEEQIKPFVFLRVVWMTEMVSDSFQAGLVCAEKQHLLQHQLTFLK